MLRYFSHQAIDGAWHAVYRIPGCNSLSSVAECPTEAAAIEEAGRFNREAEREHKAAMKRAELLGQRMAA